ncbi:MAG: lectin like domain-containing protein [Cloacibacillus sp.]
MKQIKNVICKILLFAMLTLTPGCTALVCAASEARAAESRYDMRQMLPPVRNQGDFSTCWSFAIIGAIESNLIKKGVASRDIDLSEYYLSYYTFNDESETLYSFQSDKETGFDTGASDFMSTAIVTRGTGPVYESEAPYPHRKAKAVKPPVTARKFKLKNVLYLGEDASDIPLAGERINVVKAAIAQYGGASAALCCPDEDGVVMDDLLSPSYGYFTNFKSGEPEQGANYREANHDVLLVGWDDSFSRLKFGGRNGRGPKPAKDGAWIVRNSWGKGWGDKGCFYVSYEEGTLVNGIVYDAVPAVQDENIYQYDILGVADFINGDFVPLISKNRAIPAWGANIYTALRDERLNSAAVYTARPGTQCELKIYTSVGAGSPINGTLALTKSVTLDAPGFHSIDLPAPVVVKKGERFSVVMKLTAPASEFPIPVEMRVAGDTTHKKSTSHPGESWISASGKYWTDLNTIDETANVCIKIYGTPEK